MRLTLFADYRQIYICCEAAGPNAATMWSDDDIRDGISSAPGLLAIETARAMDVAVDVALHETAPALRDADHCVEDDLTVASDRIVIAGCSDYFPDAARLSVMPGTWRVRVSVTGLSTISADGLDGDDHYRLDLWPATPSGRVVWRSAGPWGPSPS